MVCIVVVCGGELRGMYVIPNDARCQAALRLETVSRSIADPSGNAKFGLDIQPTADENTLGAQGMLCYTESKSMRQTSFAQYHCAPT
jgi:hypothetical protein